MKIVHLIPALTKGGGERVMVDLANSFARNGHDVTVVAAFKVDERLLRISLDDSIDVQYMVEKKVSRFGYYFAGSLWTLRKLGWLRTFDLLHCHLSFAAIFGSFVHFTSRFVKDKRPTVVETYHAVGMPVANWKIKVHKWLAVHRDAIAMMAYDESWQVFINRHRHIPVEVIPNGLDTTSGKLSIDTMQCFRESIGIPDSCELLVGTMGQFRPERLPTLFVKLMAMISREVGPEVHFVLIGDGTEFNSVQKAIRKHGLENRIHTPGTVNNPKLAVSVMDLYLTLNVGSVAGMAAIEAAFSGVPIIGYQLNESYAVKFSDWIWTSRNLDAIKEKAIELIRSQEKRNELGRSQMKYAISQHSQTSMQSNYLNFYQRAIEASERR